MGFRDSFRCSAGPQPGTWYDFLSNGVVGTFSTPRYLQLPDKWKESEAKWKRSPRLLGYTRSIAAPYTFVETTASLLKFLYYNGTIERKVWILIERLNSDTNLYEIFFDGEIDLSTFVDGVPYNNGSKGVSAAVIQGGIESILDASGSTPNLIPISASDCDYVYHDGIALRNTAYYTAISIMQVASVDARQHQPLLSNYYNEAQYKNDIVTDIAMDTGGPSSIIANSHFYTASYAGNVVVTYSGIMTAVISTASGSISDNFVVVVSRDRGGVISSTTMYSSMTTIGGTSVFNINASATVACQPGDTLTLIIGINPFSSSGSAGRYYFDCVDGKMSVSYGLRLSPTVFRSYPLRVVVDKLLTLITGQTGLLQSDYLTSQTARYQYMNPYNVQWTCGDALRNLTTNPAGVAVDPSIRISWEQMVTYLREVHGCGIDFRDGKVVVERAEFFFDKDTIIADVGEVGELTIEPAREFFASSGKWGYPAKDYDKLNGRDEPNTTCTWKYGIVRIAKEEDNTSSVRHDPYGIEQARANLSNKKTTDATSDNDVFAVETTGSTTVVTVSGTTYTAYPLYRPQNSYTQPAQTGLLFPTTMFNLTFLPILNLKRNGGMISGMFWNNPAAVLTFQATDKNPKIFINLGAGTFDATADILASDLDAALYNPNIMHATVEMKSTFLAAMRANPSGCIRLWEKGIPYKGFPMETGVKGADDNSYNTSLLATPDVDFSARVE